MVQTKVFSAVLRATATAKAANRSKRARITLKPKEKPYAIHPIMVGVDLSDFSPILIRYDAWLHRTTSAELILVNITNQKELETVQRGLCLYENFSYPDSLDQQIQAREETLKSLYGSIGGGGRSNLADVVVGSTARKLYRRSPIPLLVILAGYAQLP